MQFPLVLSHCTGLVCKLMEWSACFSVPPLCRAVTHPRVCPQKSCLSQFPSSGSLMCIPRAGQGLTQLPPLGPLSSTHDVSLGVEVPRGFSSLHSLLPPIFPTHCQGDLPTASLPSSDFLLQRVPPDPTSSPCQASRPSHFRTNAIQ